MGLSPSLTMDSTLNVQTVPLSTTPTHSRESTPSLRTHQWTTSVSDVFATGKASRLGDHATFTGTRGISKQVGKGALTIDRDMILYKWWMPDH